MISIKKLRKITEKGEIKKAKIRKKEIYALEKHLLKEVKQQAKNGCNEIKHSWYNINRGADAMPSVRSPSFLV